jgi:hypothetical protein
VLDLSGRQRGSERQEPVARQTRRACRGNGHRETPPGTKGKKKNTYLFFPFFVCFFLFSFFFAIAAFSFVGLIYSVDAAVKLEDVLANAERLEHCRGSLTPDPARAVPA